MRELTEGEIDQVAGGFFWKNWADFGEAIDNPFRTVGRAIDWAGNYWHEGVSGRIAVDWDNVGAAGMTA